MQTTFAVYILRYNCAYLPHLPFWVMSVFEGSPKWGGTQGSCHTYSGLGGSLASKVPSLRARSLGSSGSLSESLLSSGSNGFTGCPRWLFDCCGSAAAGLDDDDDDDEADTQMAPLPEAAPDWRLLRGGASGCANCCCCCPAPDPDPAVCGCGCWEETTPNSFNCAANTSKWSYVFVFYR